mmetsp:Transcript_3909/g.8520  ORF Transcript_3909/g.8520 Transcript_3909/m.8520 type:complete len:370 (+) Transcript_3909:132-1241(+)
MILSIIFFLISLLRVLGSTFICTTASAGSTSRLAGSHLIGSFFFGGTASFSYTRPNHTSASLTVVKSNLNHNSPTRNRKEEKEGVGQSQKQRKELLPYIDSSHNSATITIRTDEDDESAYRPEGFTTRLVNTVSILRELKKSSVWVEVPMSKARLIEEIEASDLGFEFHHAEGKTARLNTWLRGDIPSKVPEYATHHVGVGAVVINSEDEILCIRELRRNYHPWKIPTGLADLGESIHEAAEREVLEETGITAKFDGIFAFRHTHGMANGRSDLFFICQLIPEEDADGNVRTPVPQACEIAEAKWLPLSEYRDMVDGVTEESKGHPVMTFVMNNVFDEGMRINTTTVSSVVPGRRPTPIYFPESSGRNS